MNTRSSLSEEQREQLVGLCEQDLGFTTTARRIGVRHTPARSLVPSLASPWQAMSCGETNQEAILLRGQTGSGQPFPRWRNTHGPGEGI